MKILPASLKSDKFLLPFNTLALTVFSMLSYLTFKNYTNIQMRTFLCLLVALQVRMREETADIVFVVISLPSTLLIRSSSNNNSQEANQLERCEVKIKWRKVVRSQMSLM